RAAYPETNRLAGAQSQLRGALTASRGIANAARGNRRPAHDGHLMAALIELRRPHKRREGTTVSFTGPNTRVPHSSLAASTGCAGSSSFRATTLPGRGVRLRGAAAAEGAASQRSGGAHTGRDVTRSEPTKR